MEAVEAVVVKTLIHQLQVVVVHLIMDTHKLPQVLRKRVLQVVVEAQVIHNISLAQMKVVRLEVKEKMDLY